MELKFDKAQLKVKGEPIGGIENVQVEINDDNSVDVRGEFPTPQPVVLELSKKEPPKGDVIGKQETLYLDENDRVYRINEHGEKSIVVSFESAEFEQGVKLELYMKKYFERIKAWHNSNGMKTPPLAWDEKNSKWVWLNRKARRQ